MSLDIKLQPETLRSLAFGSIGAAYAGIGTALDEPSRMLIIQNLTDAALLFSFDGVNDHLILNTEVSLVMDVTTNKSSVQGLYFSAGTRIYVKRSGVPTSGSVYVSSFYGSGV